MSAQRSSTRGRPRTLVYLDSSALVKLVVAEAETAELLAYLRRRPSQVTSRVAAIEVQRAVARHGSIEASRTNLVLEQVTLIELDSDIADRAGTLAPTTLRSLDAIHIASVLRLKDELESVVTYDDRFAAGAVANGMPVVSPGAAVQVGGRPLITPAPTT